MDQVVVHVHVQFEAMLHTSGIGHSPPDLELHGICHTIPPLQKSKPTFIRGAELLHKAEGHLGLLASFGPGGASAERQK